MGNDVTGITGFLFSGLAPTRVVIVSEVCINVPENAVILSQ